MARQDPGPAMLTRWAGQGSPPAFAPGYVGLDERSFEELLGETAHFARFVRFAGGEGDSAATWGELLGVDPTMILALLATLDVRGREEAFRAMVRAGRAEVDLARKEERLRAALTAVLALAAEVDTWLGTHHGAYSGEWHQVREMVAETVHERLAPPLRAIVAVIVDAERGGWLRETMLLRVAHFHSLWVIRIDEERSGRRARAGERRWMDAALDELAILIESFLGGIEELVRRSRALIGTTLASHGHAPHVGLLMAFLRVYERFQRQLNSVPLRIVDFYQREMLRETPAPAKPDGLYLALKRVARSPLPPPQVPAGLLFQAGRDAEGAPITFAADAPLTVTGARIGELRLWRPVAAAGGGVDRVEAAAVAIPEGPVPAFTPFDGTAPAAPAAVAPAFILASPLLALPAGPRRVTVRFLDIDAVSGLDETALADLFSQSVRLGRSTPEGWVDVAAPDVDCLLDTQANVAFSFELDEAAAPMAVPAEPEAGAPSLPALRFTLSQAKRTVVNGEGRPIDVMPYRLLGAFAAGGVRIEVECERLEGVSLSTPSGPVSADSGAIPLFGAQPLAGSWLRIDHPLLASGAVRRVQVDVDWAALPPDPTGFTGYYAQYVVGPERRVVDPAVEPLFTNDGFRVEMVAPFGAEGRRLRRARLFSDADGTAYLTQPAPEQPALLPTSRFVAEARIGEAAGEDPRAAILVLKSPPYGFGDVLYPANVAYATALIAAAAEEGLQRPSLFEILLRWLKGLLGALLKALLAPFKAAWALVKKAWDRIGDFIFARGYLDDPEAEAPPPDAGLPPPPPASAALLPNPPWHPLASAIRVGCRASAEWPSSEAGAADIQLFQVPPFEAPQFVPLAGRTPLFPPLPPKPCFDLAIEDWPAGTELSLLFSLGSPAPGEPASGEVVWLERIGRDWTPLGGAEDGTRSLSRTGLLRLSVPGARRKRTWIRAAAAGSGAGFAPVAGIWPDALWASRRLAAGAAAPLPIPAGTVARAPEIPGIQSVEQPLPSSGGSPGESADDMSRRTAARLRHKDRAVLAWDVEQLALERFPEIGAIRVLPGRSPDGKAVPGSVTAVVLPRAPLPGEPPRVSAQLRGQVAQWLGRRSSPFAEIAVVDPVCVPLDILVRARFAGDARGAERLEPELLAFLAPGSGAIGLADQAGSAELRGRIAAFIRERDYVGGLERLSIALGDGAPAPTWFVPLPRRIDIAAIAFEDGEEE